VCLRSSLAVVTALAAALAASGCGGSAWFSETSGPPETDPPEATPFPPEELRLDPQDEYRERVAEVCAARSPEARTLDEHTETDPPELDDAYWGVGLAIEDSIALVLGEMRRLAGLRPPVGDEGVDRLLEVEHDKIVVLSRLLSSVDARNARNALDLLDRLAGEVAEYEQVAAEVDLAECRQADLLVDALRARLETAVAESEAPPPPPPTVTAQVRETCAKFSAVIRKRKPPERAAGWVNHANVVGLLAIQEMAELGRIERAGPEDADLIWNLVVLDGGIATAALNLETALVSNKRAVDDARAELELFEAQWDDFARQHELAECERFG
jgi:hypothetical protein